MSNLEVHRHHAHRKSSKNHFTCEFCHAKLPIGTEQAHQEQCPEVQRVLQENPLEEISCELCEVVLPVDEMNDHILAHLLENEAQQEAQNSQQRENSPVNNAPRIENRNNMIGMDNTQRIRIILQNNGRPRGFLMINSPVFNRAGAPRRVYHKPVQRPADSSKVRNFPVSRFKSEENVSCTICMEQIKKKEKVKTLPCMHIFHPYCIDEWLSRSNQCPICKFQI
ncbi:unnamed protein product [Blepharisma stoltei]|uniref:RING-type domain-containing protein n=1 Tax=Blepharisma stoltei TaxID=1481888 RepID=A0AAU9JAT9_9CILI|nr:unnamed protein product [Blepharisma stoltei]